MIIQSKSILFSLIIILSLIIVFNCSKNSTNELLIGVIYSKTGAAARYGESVFEGLQLALDRMRKEGILKNINLKIIYEDDASESKLAVSAFYKLIEHQGLNIIIGPVPSNSAMACSPLANKYKVILFSPSAATPEYSSKNDFTFRNRPNADAEIRALARYIVKNKQLLRIGCIIVNNDYGLGNLKAFQEHFKAEGGIIVKTEYFQPLSTDVRSQISVLKRTTLDSILIIGEGPEGGYILKQMKEMSLELPKFSTISIEDEDVLKIAGDAAEGVEYIAPSFNPNLPTSNVMKEFINSYITKYNKYPNLFAANAYDALMILIEAIKNVGNDPKSIKTYLLNLKNYSGVSGETTFDIYGDVSKTLTLKVIRNGKYRELLNIIDK